MPKDEDRSNGSAPEDAVVVEPEPDAPEDRPLSGVLVVPTYDEEGGVAVDVQRIGETRITEVPTLLRTAVRIIEARLGISSE